MIVVFSVLQADPNRQTLHDFDEVAGGIFGRQHAGTRASGSRHALDISLIFAAKGIDFDVDGLSSVHFFQLCFLKICGDPDIFRLSENPTPTFSLSDFPWAVRAAELLAKKS
jgi:hypothetical protein